MRARLSRASRMMSLQCWQALRITCPPSHGGLGPEVADEGCVHSHALLCIIAHLHLCLIDTEVAGGNGCSLLYCHSRFIILCRLPIAKVSSSLLLKVEPLSAMLLRCDKRCGSLLARRVSTTGVSDTIRLNST